MAVISEVSVKLTAEEAWTWLAGWLAGCTFLFQRDRFEDAFRFGHASVCKYLGAHVHSPTKTAARKQADSIPSSPALAAPAATETAYQGGRNSGWTCQPCPIDWTV